ncbi:1-acyl-sn-glycerol-3-phosphate acyltransferase [Noviherbaspirillum humi]|uniref:1-acyl-sn-glycerol-3-phosphate acyltransferase n=1 Tax=Noviherbaspirillum humi TaxID=1688639 RepID=A0A239KCK7_9BURK|nr:lysophospholipid acyltransferase family protein [Noviherbaspirillum humi]SNT14854.1 1-acyl-sn-glycerol-3-phosphate acyltransferase [Noviherbaspirillum humi]
MSTPLLYLRSCVFMLLFALSTAIWAPICFLFALLPYRQHYNMTVLWNRFNIQAARLVCGIRYQIKGEENLPDEPAIVLCKHQSTWETLFLCYNLTRPLVFVYKRELNYVPFFGWGIALLRMIPINRSKGKDAFAQVVELGRQRLQEGRWPVLFPEGTRIPVGLKGKYKTGGARLAVEAGVPVIPIAVNSGECWPKKPFIKKPGLITVSIGKPIRSAGLTPAELMQQVENWIESEMRVISSPGIYTIDNLPNHLEAASSDPA